MTPARGVEYFLVPAKAIDRLGDKAMIPGGTGPLDLAFTPAVAG